METGGVNTVNVWEEEQRKLYEELEESLGNLLKGSSHEDGSDKTNGSNKGEEDGESDTDYRPEEDYDEARNEEEEEDEDQRVATLENLGNYPEILQKALIGDLDGDFPKSVRVVRIFTSSTFTGKLSRFESGDRSLELLTLLL